MFRFCFITVPFLLLCISVIYIGDNYSENHCVWGVNFQVFLLEILLSNSDAVL